MKNISFKLLVCGLCVCALSLPLAAQRRGRNSVTAKTKPIIFAVINDGKQLEPIAQVEKGKLITTVSGGDEEKILLTFVNAYYKPKTAYRLIFGGANDGTATVTAANPKSDCAKNLADVSTKSVKGKIKGLVMALATNEVSTRNGSGVRRLPTFPERAEIEALVRAEFAKQKLNDSAVKNLRYHNLTALDVDNDKKAEMVGSFWLENSASERNLLFFIADKGSDGKYALSHSEYRKILADEVMNNEIKTLDDNGTYHELLLDVFDVDNDGVAEVFTIIKGFEGNSFVVYRRQDGKWTKSFDSANYHCAF